MAKRKKKSDDLLDVPEFMRRKKGSAKLEPVTMENDFFDTARFEPVDVIPGQLAYVWLYGEETEEKSRTNWPVSGWAPYLLWRWDDREVTAWHVATLSRLYISRRDDVLKHARIVPTDNITPAYVAAKIRHKIATYDRVERSYYQGVLGVAGFLETLKTFDEAVTPAPSVEFDEGGLSEGEDDMAAKKATAEKKTGAGRKPGSGAFIRECLLDKKNTMDDEQIAAEARKKFGGKTGVNDVRWNRNKLRKEGKLPPAAKKEKAAAKKAA